MRGAEDGETMRKAGSFVVVRMFCLFCLAAWSLCGFTQTQSTPQNMDTRERDSYTAHIHLSGGLTCKDCHGEGPKKPVTQEKCRQCHGEYRDIAPLTAEYTPNPHNNHDTDNLSCTQCHHMHQPAEVYCQQCHAQMVFVLHAAPKK